MNFDSSFDRDCRKYLRKNGIYNNKIWRNKVLEIKKKLRNNGVVDFEKDKEFLKITKCKPVNDNYPTSSSPSPKGVFYKGFNNDDDDDESLESLERKIAKMEEDGNIHGKEFSDLFMRYMGKKMRQEYAAYPFPPKRNVSVSKSDSYSSERGSESSSDSDSYHNLSSFEVEEDSRGKFHFKKKDKNPNNAMVLVAKYPSKKTSTRKSKSPIRVVGVRNADSVIINKNGDPILKKRARCPNGSHRNQFTGNCDPNMPKQPKQNKTKKSPPKKTTPKNSPIKTKKRCPNGTRMNKKTGKCEPKK
jgi:hypothetical protein